MQPKMSQLLQQFLIYFAQNSPNQLITETGDKSFVDSI